MKNDLATIYYYDIGDYLSREEKLAKIKDFRSIANMADKFHRIQPNKHGDWISHRDEGFEELIPLAPETKLDKNPQSIFVSVGGGLKTNRDAWVYSYSKRALNKTIQGMIDFYNAKRIELLNTKVSVPAVTVESIDAYDAKQITWTRGLREDADRNKTYTFDAELSRVVLYRPFCKQHVYSIHDFIEVTGASRRFFPSVAHANLVICVPGIGGTKDFSLTISDQYPDYEFIGKCQCFPLYYYDKKEQDQHMNLFDTGEEYVRRDGISDFILARVRELCGPKVTKLDIFHYVYGILHSPQYREKFAVNLKKTLPRLPLPDDPKTFWAYSKAGKALSELHLNYETLPPHPAVKEDSPKPKPSTRVQKMRFAKREGAEDKTAIIYNDDITVWNIPLEAYDYVVNG